MRLVIKLVFLLAAMLFALFNNQKQRTTHPTQLDAISASFKTQYTLGKGC